MVYPTQNTWTDGYADYYPTGDDGSSIDANSNPLYSGETVDPVGDSADMGFNATSAILFDLAAVAGSVTNAQLALHIAAAAGSPFLTLWGSTDTSWDPSVSLPGGTITTIETGDTSALAAGDWKTVNVTAYIVARMAANKKASLLLYGHTDQISDDYFEFDCMQDLRVAMARPDAPDPNRPRCQRHY